MKCPACGTRLAKEATFCHKCYTSIVTTAAPSATSTTAASPGPAAPSIPVSVPIRRSRRVGRGPRLRASIVSGALALILAVLIVVVLLLTRPWEGHGTPEGAGTGTVSAIALLSGDGSGGRWRLGGAGGATSVTSAQTPGCMEGPCSGTMTVRFGDGRQTTVDDIAGIAEIGQVAPAHYLAVAGFCYLNCVVRVYGIDTAARAVTTVLDRAHPNPSAPGNPLYFPMPEGACGFALTYRGATYTVRTLPDKKSPYFASWLLYPGDKRCPPRSHNAGSSESAGGVPVVPPSTATAQATPVVAAPQDTQAPTVTLQDTPTSTVVAQDTPTATVSDAAPRAGALVRIGGGQQLGALEGMTVDAAGNVYVVGEAIIKRIDRRTGAITTVAGTGTAGYSGDDGPATQANIHTLNAPGMAVDGAGNLYFVDQGNSRIRRVDARTRIITTVAGTGGEPTNDPPTGIAATQAPLAVVGSVMFLAVDAQGNVFFEQALSTISGIYEVEARTGLLRLAATLPPSANGQPSAIGGIALDHAGSAYLVDDTGHIHKQRLFSGKDTIVAGDGRSARVGALTAEGTGELATRLTLGPWGYVVVATDAAGTLFITDGACRCVRAIAPGTDRVIAVPAATRVLRARGSSLYYMTFDGAGTMYFTDVRGSIYDIISVGRAARAG